MSKVCATIVNASGKSFKGELLDTDFLPISQLRQAQVEAVRSAAAAQAMVARTKMEATNLQLEAARAQRIKDTKK